MDILWRSPPTEAPIKSFIYHSVPDILDKSSSFDVALGSPSPTYSPQKMPLLRAISMYEPVQVQRISKKSDASHKYVTR